MSRMARHLQPGTMQSSVMRIMQQMLGHSPGPDDTIVIDLLSNSTQMGTDCDEVSLPPFLGRDGVYHIPDVFTTPPPSMIKKNHNSSPCLSWTQLGGQTSF